MEILGFVGVLLGLAGLFWLAGRLIFKTQRNEGNLHGDRGGSGWPIEHF